MKARVAVFGKRGTGFTGYLPTIGLEFSEEVGGGGSCSFEALMSDVDARAAWDAVLVVELETSPGVWTVGPAYATRHDYTHPAGFRRFKFTAQALLEAWGGDAVVMPEYVVGTMPRGAGTERGVGWMSSAYDPPDEDWDACYETSRTTMPPFWPSGTGAKWISASGSTSETESKYFRAGLTLSSKKTVQWFLSSDEPATLWVAGERAIETGAGAEAGKKEYTKQTMVLYPGTYAVGVYTATHSDKGGDGIDPILVAAETLDADGEHGSWILASNEDDWVACRRDDEPPDDIPPGPTPGMVLRYLVGEASERNCSGWPNVTLGFTDTHDSYGVAWADVSERLFTYGQTSYWDVLQSLAESDEVDTWMGPGLVLHAAPKQGQARAITFTETHLNKFATKGTSGAGSWVMAQAYDGWLTEKLDGHVRREYALELGEALTRSTGRKIAQASLRDRWRWDASGSLNPPQAGWIPYVDFKVGDSMAVDYQAVVHDVAVLSISAKAGEGGLLFDVELTEYPIDTSAVA